MAFGSKLLGYILAAVWLAILIFMFIPPNPELMPTVEQLTNWDSLAPLQRMTHAGQLFFDLPQWVVVWMGVMTLLFVIVLFYAPSRKGAQVYLVGIIISHAVSLGGIMFFMPLDTNWQHWSSFTHWSWIPAGVYLAREWPSLNKKSIYGVWSSLAIFQIVFSMIFDIPDGIRFLNQFL